MVENIEGNRKLTSEDLAALIVDGLVDAKLIDEEKFDEAVKVATLEIEIRKAAGDY